MSGTSSKVTDGVDGGNHWLAPGITREELLRFCHEAPLSSLPVPASDTMEQIIQLVGWPGLFHLIDVYGGTEIFFRNSHEFNEQKYPDLSPDLVHFLSRRTANGQYSVPTFFLLIAAYRRHLATQLISDGASYNQVARRLGIAARMVRILVRGQASNLRLAQAAE